jgi:radial spoke head protein 9
MKISNINSELKFVNRIGQTLSTEERISLEVSVLKLSQEYHFENFNLWGRIEGVLKNYYVVEGVNFRGATNFLTKKYFWRYNSKLFQF